MPYKVRLVCLTKSEWYALQSQIGMPYKVRLVCLTKSDWFALQNLEWQTWLTEWILLTLNARSYLTYSHLFATFESVHVLMLSKEISCMPNEKRSLDIVHPSPHLLSI